MQKTIQTIDLRLYATLAAFSPPNASEYPIKTGITIARLLEDISIPAAEAKLIFVNGIKAQLATVLQGGERVGVFPPVGGG
jgi:molybdopterin synthase sulfur carrier subunit